MSFHQQMTPRFYATAMLKGSNIASNAILQMRFCLKTQKSLNPLRQEKKGKLQSSGA